jgi:predicted small secreted protein
MTVLIFELFGRDVTAGRTMKGVGKDTSDAGDKIRKLGGDADSANGPLSKLDNIAKKFASSVLDGAKNTARLAVQVGAVASTAATLAPYVAKGAVEVYQFGVAAVQASPMLLAFAAAGLFIKTTFTRIGPEILRGFNPILEMLTEAGNRASKLAGRNLPELSAGFAKANFPAISEGMNSIAIATNSVIDRFLTWGKSAAGVEAIKNLTYATGTATLGLSMHVSRLAESFGNMIGRIAGVSLAAGESGLAGVFDHLSMWMDKVNAVTVSAGLKTMKDDFTAIWHAVERVIEVTKTVIAFWHEHRQAIILVQDALSVLAIMFGGPVIAVGAAVGLIIRHWDELKAAKASLSQAMADPIAVGFMDNMKTATEAVVPALVGAWNTIWTAIGPRLTEIWNKIKNQLIPAFGEFIAAIAPVVSFLVGVLGPVVAAVFGSILNIISGVISIITGILQVFTGVLTGDWSKVWEGIKNITSGALSALWNLFMLWIGGRITMIFRGLSALLGVEMANAGRAVIGAALDWLGQLIGHVGGLPGRILSALGNLGSLLYQAGRNVIQGLINGIMAMVGAVGSAIGSVASKIRNSLPFSPAKEGPLSGMGSPDLAGAKIPSMIAAGMIKGVPQVLGAAYQLAGAAGMSGLSQGSLVGAGSMAYAGAGAGGALPPIVLQGDGSRLVDFLLEMIRKAVSDRGGDVQGTLGR